MVVSQTAGNLEINYSNTRANRSVPRIAL